MTALTSQDNEKFHRMTTAPVEKLVLTLAVPSIAIMMITSIYNMADTFFVSKLGTSAVGGIGIAFPLMAVIQAIGYFFGAGSGNYISRNLGAQNMEAASRMTVTAFVSGFLFMSCLAAAGIAGLGSLVAGLGATETIKPHAMDYIFFILLASPFMVASMLLNSQLRFQGSASIALVGMLTGAFLNMFLDPLFIFVFGMEVKGAAIATMISQMVGFSILFFYGTTRKGNIRIRFGHFSPSAARYAELFRGGAPTLVRQGLMGVTAVIINHFARVHGDAAIAAISIVNRICIFAHSAVLGFGQGFQPVCGFNYGAKYYSRVRKAFWFCVRFCTAVLSVIALALAVFAPRIIALFRSDADVIAIGVRGLRLNCIGLPSVAVVIICNMASQTMGKTLEASIAASSRQGLFLIPCLFILSPWYGLFGTQLSTPVSDILSLIVVIPIIIRVMKSLSVPDGIANGPVRQPG